MHWVIQSSRRYKVKNGKQRKTENVIKMLLMASLPCIGQLIIFISKFCYKTLMFVPHGSWPTEITGPYSQSPLVSGVKRKKRPLA